MKRKQFAPEQIVVILREAETGTLTVAELCRKHGIQEVTFHRWRRRYQGMTVSDAKELKRLIDENAHLKKLLAKRDLEVDALKLVLAKKPECY
jgi:putative transposase